MRGLKRHILYDSQGQVKVASFTDAWIETGYKWVRCTEAQSHPLRMRGLKLSHNKK